MTLDTLYTQLNTSAVWVPALGTAALKKRYPTGNPPSQRASTSNARRFTQTGHSLGGSFRDYWESHGALPQQGYPISDEFTETSALDGKSYTVQYFQRAVFGISEFLSDGVAGIEP